MKSPLVSLALVSLFSLFSFVGCSTLRSPTTGEIDPIQLERQINEGAILLQATTFSATIIVLDRYGYDVAPYVELAIAILDKFLVDGGTTPKELQNALYALPVKELDKPEVALVVSTVVAAYSIYFERYVKGQVNGNEIASKFLFSIREGANNALRN